MINLFSWLALLLVISQLWFMGSKRYRIGWWLALAASLAWSIFAIAVAAWALLAQQIIIAFLAIRGLRKL